MGFLEEPLLGRLVSGQVRCEEFDGDLALQARVLGRVDDPHPAVAQFGADRVRAEGGAWAQGHGGLETQPIIPEAAGRRPCENRTGSHRWPVWPRWTGGIESRMRRAAARMRTGGGAGAPTPRLRRGALRDRGLACGPVCPLGQKPLRGGGRSRESRMCRVRPGCAGARTDRGRGVCGAVRSLEASVRADLRTGREISSAFLLFLDGAGSQRPRPELFLFGLGVLVTIRGLPLQVLRPLLLKLGRVVDELLVPSTPATVDLDGNFAPAQSQPSHSPRSWTSRSVRSQKTGSPDIKVGRSPGRSDQELCDLGRNRLIHGFFWDLPEQYFLASVDGRLRKPRSGWGACSAAAKSRRKVFNLWLLLDDRWAGDTAQVEPVR